MLGDKELGAASGELAEFRKSHIEHQDALSQVLEKYEALVLDYKRLKSDYEEERDARERYKQMARGQQSDPFVLVLVDGDGYIFDDDVVKDGTEGGQRAAQILDDAVKRSLRSRGLEDCRVMVRVYANLVGLSKTLSRVNLVGCHPRSLAPFTASFTRARGLFDFVDAADLKEGADFKIREMFSLFAENSQCKHIYFAGCHDVGYLSLLTPYQGNRDRITLINTAAFHPQFATLDMKVEEFPRVFRYNAIDSNASTRSVPAGLSAMVHRPQSEELSKPVCFFFQKGICKYGKSCKNAHVRPDDNNGRLNSTQLSDIKDWRQNSSDAPMPPWQSNGVKHDPVQTQLDLATALPRPEAFREGHIPVNLQKHRLDAYLSPVSSENMAEFKYRITKRKLCNTFHFNGACKKGKFCEYDHSPVSPGVFQALKTVVSVNPCPGKGACRKPNCTYGHICQKAGCRYRGGNAFCKYSPQVHSIDMNVAEWAPVAAKRDGSSPPESVMNSTADVDSTETDVESEVEGEMELSEGALLPETSLFDVD